MRRVAQGVKCQPHETLMTWPVTVEDASLARKHTMPATSLGVASRRSGVRSASALYMSQCSLVHVESRGPGATELARTPYGPSSAAKSRVSECSAALVAPYTPSVQPARYAATDVTLMIEPRCCCFIPGANAFMSIHGDLRFTFMVSSQSDSSSASSSLMGEMAALFTRMST